MKLRCWLLGHRFPRSEGGIIGLIRKLRSRCVRCRVPYMDVFGR